MNSLSSSNNKQSNSEHILTSKPSLAIMGDDIDYAAMDTQPLDSMTGPLFPNPLYFSPESSLYGSVYAAGVPLNNGQLESYELSQYQNGYPSPDASARSLSDVSTFSSLSSTSLNREQYTADSSLGGTPMDLENGINLSSKRGPPFGFDSTADSNSAVHDGGHSFPCDEGCDVAFRRIYDLKRHKKEQHRCVHPDCDALRFSNRSEKDQHEALHGGGLQWRCGSCLQIDPNRKPYSRHDKLKRHLKDHHDVSDANLDAFRCNNPSCFVGEGCGGLFFCTLTSLQKHLRDDHNESMDGTAANVEYAPVGTSVQATSAIVTATKRSQESMPTPDPKRYRSRKDETSLEDKTSKSTQDAASHLSQAHVTSLECPTTQLARTPSNGKMVKPLPLVQVSHVLQHCNEQSVECFAMTGVEFHFLTKQWNFQRVISDLTRLCIKLFLVSSEFKVELRGSVSQDYMQRGKDLFAGLIESARPAASCVSGPDSLAQCSKPAEAQTASYHHQPDFLALDPIEDAVALVTWHQFLLPEFPLIAKQSPIRGRYSVSLVAQVKDNAKHLIIRFRSSENQSNACRDFIRKRVEEICKEHGRMHFPIQFSQGTLVRLLGTAPSYNDLDDPSTDQEFAHHRRFWQTPGMGASIGLSQCPKISATLGGYILVDGRLFMLSVDHFISKCGCPNKNTSVRSPAHSDAQELKKQVEERLQDINSRLSRNGETEIGLSNYSQVIDRNTQMEIDLYERFRRELMQDDSRFNFGHVHRRSGDGSPPTRPAAIPVTPGEVRRTDWSLTEVTEGARVGQNAHRHSRMSVPTLEDLRSEVMTPEGTGALVTTTANVRGGEAVHYVGTTSGLRHGRVNPGITLYGTEGGEISHEWTIAVEGNANLNSKAFSGDSGAWIMNDDNELLGHLWGWDGGLLWFTPIADVFQDIREHLNAANVTLRDDRLRLNSQGLISRGEGCSETNNGQLEEQGTKMARPNPSPSPSPMSNLLSPTDAEDKGRRRSSSVGSDLSIFSLPSLGSSSSMSSVTEGNSPQVPGSPCSYTAYDDIGDSKIVSQELPPTDESCDWYYVRQDAELKDEESSREDALELTLRPRRVVGIKTF